MSNTITNVTPQLLAMGLKALRQNAILPQLINRQTYDNLAQRKGNVINVPIPSAIAARSVTPAVTYAANVDSAPTVANVTLDRWMEAPFQMSDSDMTSVMEGTIPMQASEAIKALGNDIDTYILGKHTGFYNIVGTSIVTPFATLSTAALAARTLLNKSLAPMTDRSAVIDPDAEANLLANSEVLKFNERGDGGGIIEGAIGRKFGVNWYMDQNITTALAFNAGTAWSTTTAAILTTTANSTAGITSLVVISTLSGKINVGAIFGFATGIVGYHVVTAIATLVTATTNTLSIYPPLRQLYAANTTLTLVGMATMTENYIPNLMIHRDAFAFASRPLADISVPGSFISSQIDPVTGISLRLEVSRQYKQTTFSYDVLYGCNVVRPEFGCVIRGIGG